MDEPKVVRTGVLYKKGKKVGVFGRDNWKPRFCVLTWSKLQYFTCEGGILKGELDLTRCGRGAIAVMPNDCMKTGRSASSIWRVAITTPHRRFLIAAPTEFDMRDWIRDLVKVTMRHDVPILGASSPSNTEAEVYRTHPFARPMLLDSLDVLAKTNRRNITLVPGQLQLRRGLRMAQHHERDRAAADII
ncbi:hypothetical protein H310_09245 [Aphanomyces invadans]|uniref:PH domain-containing protein n=1 Tax=Aphanomyces invadans TaxID=157072 RepID=A0A024TUV1_9STRA|nr:hypothetical protein H310_09245 [Aphanomyces invadans]ETV97930.1 hypothetical protein H310_09245 [Aphanomyces invadans]RHY33220.1 hypothetical protein DYB32_001793 [Aphanomyces invadans]|eukprot:XP_008873491.1 hypothetical protein H310_09245 [Aphanomyces invadans]